MATRSFQNSSGASSASSTAYKTLTSAVDSGGSFAQTMARQNNANIQNNFSNISAQRTSLQTRNVQIMQEQSKLIAQNKSLQNTIANANAKKESLNQNLSQLKEKSSDLAAAQAANDEVMADPNSSPMAVEQAAMANEELQAQKDHVDSAVADTEKQVAAQEKTVTDATKKIADNTAKSDALTQEGLSNNKKLDALPTTQDVELAKGQVSNIQSTNGKTAIAQEIASTSTTGKSDLFDLRNIAGKNFRGSGGAGKATTGANFVLAASRSFFMEKDFLFADTINGHNRDSFASPQVQPLILNEFQPYEMVSPADALGSLISTASSILQKCIGMAAEPVVKVGGKLITNATIDKYSKDTSQIYLNTSSKGARVRSYFTTDPVQVVQNMFNGGKWLNTYEIPFYGNDYLDANYSGKWSNGDATNFLGALGGPDGAADRGSFSLKGFGIDFPSNPKFQVAMEPTRKDIISEFYLINKNNQWLKKNFEFLNAIYAGTNWLHMKYCIVRPPNVYHVLCPGRFQIYWAAMNCEVTFEGKLRKNEEVSAQLMNNSKAIDKDMLWPDAWKIRLTIHDLTPNNFNMYAEYFLNGFNINEVKQLEEQKGIEGIAKDLIDYVGKFKGDYGALVSDVASKAATATKNAASMLTKAGATAAADKLSE